MRSRMKDTLLLIGGKESDRSELHAIFEPEYYLLEAENAPQGTLLLKQNGPCIAAVLADIPLTEETAIRALIEASNPGTEQEIPVILLISPSGTGQQEERAFMMGAADVVLKPYTRLSVQRRVQVLVDLYLHRWHLERLVEEQNQAIRDTYQSIFDTMSSIIEHRNMESGNHILRIRGFAKILLQEVVKSHPSVGLTPEDIETISAATGLHDIGKLLIPDAILNKPGPLTPAEFDTIKKHTTLGSELIAQLPGAGETAYLRYAYNICLYHHERWDGSGYPMGLRGEEIPLCAQVAGITDAFDALTSPRVYKPAFPCETAINMILNGDCGVFAPPLLECFKQAHQKLIQLSKQYADGQISDAVSLFAVPPTPEQNDYPLDSVQLSQLKYQTLLHHLNDTVIELDMNSQLYHVVHNPNPDFVRMVDSIASRDHLQSLILAGVHPEDAVDMEQWQSEIVQMLFVEKRRKCIFRCRVFNPPYNRFDPYEITLLRVNTGNPSQRLVIAVFHNLEAASSPLPPAMTHTVNAADTYDLVSPRLCCRLDDCLTILDGSNMLLSLTGYTPWEISQQFSNALINMIVPEDRERLLSMARSSGESVGLEEDQFRVCHKTRGSVWVLIRCRVHTEADGRQYLYLALTDITSVKTAERELSRDYVRNRVIVNQFQNVILEWDLVTDQLACSEHWKDRFGFEVNPTAFSKVLSSASHVHPDDLPELRKRIAALRRQEGMDVLDLRIADHSGRYTWNRIRAVSRAEGQEAPTCIIAVIYNIDDLKSDVLKMKKRAEQDMLTKLLNKASTQQAVTDYLEEREPNALAALLLLDLDNFKLVNDTYGHMYGDAILTQVGSNLRNLFRSRDVVGRVGGDEFMVLLKDLPNEEILHERCSLLINSFRQQLGKLMPELPISVSIGGALAPQHGTSWAELFRHADDALYNAKHKGKGQYKIYDAVDTDQVLLNPITHTQIDSDHLPVLNDDALVRYVFQILYTSPDLKAAIEDVLAFVGTHFGVSRVYIFENSKDNTTCKNTFEWCNIGITPQKEFLQCVNYEQDVPNWQSSFNENGILYSSDIRELPDDLREILEPQGIKSLLHCAIMDQGIFRGVVGFDECNASYLWTQEQISLLQFLSEVLAVFLLKEQNVDLQD